jgi:RND superfamily putative drug exporter
LRDHIADFDDFFRPLRNYFYWEPHCFDIPICWSIRSIFDTLDGVDTMTDDIQNLLPDLEKLGHAHAADGRDDAAQIETMKSMQQITLTMYQSQKSQQDQNKAMQENQTAMGQAFDSSKNDDSFYLPPEGLRQSGLQARPEDVRLTRRKAVRFIISHEGDPATPEGIKLIPQSRARRSSHQGHAVGGLEDLSGGYRVDLQGHAGGFELGSC